ncbi:hypothetical protein RFI_02254, partial [Reticulomyxa filosa]
YIANVWIGRDSNPFTFEFMVEYAKHDIFIGVITEEYKQPNDLKNHHLGLDEQSVGISVRDRVAYFNGSMLTTLDSSQNSTKPLNSFNYVQLFQNEQSRPIVRNIDISANPIIPTHAPSNNPVAFYNIKRSSTVTTSTDPQIYKKNQTKQEYSKTLSVQVNDDLLEPLYFQFSSRVTAAITLCHCLDEVTLENVLMDLTRAITYVQISSFGQVVHNHNLCAFSFLLFVYSKVFCAGKFFLKKKKQFIDTSNWNFL